MLSAREAKTKVECILGCKGAGAEALEMSALRWLAKNLERVGDASA